MIDIQKLAVAVKAEDPQIKDGPGLRVILNEIYKDNNKDIDKAMDDAMKQAKSGALKKKSDKRLEEIIAKRREKSKAVA
jgi:hypothetical protein